MITIFVIGLLYSEVDVLICTFRTLPSIVGWTLMILPMAQFPRTELESSMITLSSTLTVHFSAFHIFLGTNDGNTFRVQRLQKVSSFCCTNLTICCGFLVPLNGLCGTIDVACPRSMSLGQIQAVIWVVSYSTNGPLIHQVSHL